MTAGLADAKLNTSTVQVVNDWPWLTAAKHYILLKQYHKTSLKGNLKWIKPDGMKVNAFKAEVSCLLLFTFYHSGITLC